MRKGRKGLEVMRRRRSVEDVDHDDRCKGEHVAAALKLFGYLADSVSMSSMTAGMAASGKGRTFL
jgi:hypothetical protein